MGLGNAEHEAVGIEEVDDVAEERGLLSGCGQGSKVNRGEAGCLGDESLHLWGVVDGKEVVRGDQMILCCRLD